MDHAISESMGGSGGGGGGGGGRGMGVRSGPPTEKSQNTGFPSQIDPDP